MEGIVYHGSSNGNILVLKPNKSTHGKDFVYATPNRTAALLFIHQIGRDLDTRISTVDGKLEIIERREGVFDNLYNRSGYLYTLPANTFKHYDYLWSQEVVSEDEVSILSVEEIPNILAELTEEEKLGNITIYRYPSRPESVPLDNSDLIDKYIKFEENGFKGAIDKLLSVYPEFESEVKRITSEERKG